MSLHISTSQSWYKEAQCVVPSHRLLLYLSQLLYISNKHIGKSISYKRCSFVCFNVTGCLIHVYPN